MHYVAWVVVPGKHAEVTDEVSALVADLMAPHKETWDEDDSEGFWDWYQIGGRWSDMIDGDIVPVQGFASEKFPYRYLDSKQTFEKQMRNPSFMDWDHTDEHPYFIDTADFVPQVVAALRDHQDDTIVVVDYHS